jgi:hypothetical protein
MSWLPVEFGVSSLRFRTHLFPLHSAHASKSHAISAQRDIEQETLRVRREYGLWERQDYEER